MINDTPPPIMDPPQDYGMYNFTISNLTEFEIYERFCPAKMFMDKYVTPIVYVLGFPGNVLAFVIWLTRRMRNSSGYYLASLAVTDFFFLTLHVLFELQTVWNKKVLDFPVLCESYTVFYLFVQYMSPLLVMGFTIERYISIVHPFKRERYCTTRRAKIVILCLAIFSLCLCAIQGYFWTYTTGFCTLRDEVTEGGTASLWSIWAWVTELMIFLVVPLLVLLFNMFVILEARRLSRFEESQLHGRANKTSATTIMLLAVSFYLIFTTLPVTITYALFFNFPIGNTDMTLDQVVDDPTWTRHFNYTLVNTVIREIGITHYACNFYIYLLTGKQFRAQFRALLLKLACRKPKGSPYNSDYTSLKNGSQRAQKTVYTTVEQPNGNPPVHSEESTSNL